MLKILQARLQQYMSHKLTDVQAGFRKGKGTRDQVSNVHWLFEGAREFQKNIYFCFIDYTKDFDFGSQQNVEMWKNLQELGIPDHLTCLLRNLYAGQEATVRTDIEQQNGSKSGKEDVNVVYCHPAYLTSMQSASCEMSGWMKHKLE